MTHPSNDHNRDLEELFHKARRVESRRAPDFDAMLHQPERSHPPRVRPRRLLAIGFSTVALAALAVTGAFRTLVPGLGSGHPAPVTTATSQTMAQSSSPKGLSLWRFDTGQLAPPVVPSRPEILTYVPPPAPPTPTENPRPKLDKNLTKRLVAEQDRDVKRSEMIASTSVAGAISVTVTAQDGTDVPEARVVISHPHGYVKKSATTANGYGVAEFPVLRATGQANVGYTIDVEFPGFAPVRLVDVKTGGGETTNLLVRLSEDTERVAVVARVAVVDLEATSQTTKFTDEYVQDLPVPGRFYQSVLRLAPGVHDADGDGNPNVSGSRSRDFKAEVAGVRNVDPLAGPRLNPTNPNSIEQVEMVSAGSGVEFSRAQGGFARIIGEDQESELRSRTEPWNAEGYRPIEDNPYLSVTENPLSTFSIDVDTASFSNVRRFLATGALPPPDAVRIEELINYFDYDYPSPSGGAPFSTDVAIVDCPWNPAHRLARIGIKGREVHRAEHAGGNLVFLIDVSGSMDHPSKLPLLQSALKLMVEQLTARDQVAIVVYAGSSGLVLDSTSGDAKAEILDAIDRLKAGGSTNGGAGLRLAYKIARDHFVPGGVNRVILATDGDFNVGVTSHGGLLSSIQKDADNGIFMTALGFGYGNFQDDRLEHLADKGNGNYAYIDRLREARKVLVDELAGTLITIAKDVKIQIEFNPLEVGAYRLIGYENRLLAKEDFNDDRKDAGEIGAGHTVTALYELVPPDKVGDLPAVDELRYQTTTGPSDQADSGEAFTLKLRYKKPEGQKSHLLTFAIVDEGHTLEAAPPDVKFSAAVAQFGLLLRDSEHKGSASFGSVEALALEGTGADSHGYRAEFLEMVRAAESLVAESKPIE